MSDIAGVGDVRERFKGGTGTNADGSGDRRWEKLR